MPPQRQEFTAEFKRDAVQLVLTTGKSCAQIARDLGLPPHYVVRWKKHHEQQTASGRPAFAGRGVAALSAQEGRTRQLERELDVTRQERDILKKALAFFAKNA